MKLNYTVSWFDRFILSTDANSGILTLYLAYMNMFHSQKTLIHKTGLNMLSKKQYEDRHAELALLSP